MKKRIFSLLITLIIVAVTVVTPISSVAETKKTVNGDYSTLINTASRWIVVRNQVLGGTHYAYSESVSGEAEDPGPQGNDGWGATLRSGSEMVILSLKQKSGKLETTEEIILNSDTGVIRDPDVSSDGTTVVFSWKKSVDDDYHLYSMDLTAINPQDTVTQLTFGSDIADTEPKFLANGKIVFSSTRCIQNIDCHVVPVSNLFICNSDGTDIIRIGYDQVTTTYPTVTDDGRIIYTRWDYNDRNHMYIQGLFQMQQDGTNQTELWGNNACTPTSLLHARSIPGESSKYVAIAGGHHALQWGKLVIIDTSVDRNSADAVTFVFPEDGGNLDEHIDAHNTQVPLYKYPYALNDHEFLVSYLPSTYTAALDAPFGLYYMNSETGEQTEICSANGTRGASQCVPIKERDIFNRPSMVNYGQNTGTYYVADVYSGEGMESFERTEDNYIKYLRVVALEYRTSAVGVHTNSSSFTQGGIYTPVAVTNGTWDVKRILGITDVYSDGSAMFKVPSDTPVYFQLLNQDGEMVQTMRSWSTLMPGETFSCIGCHEDKNTVPPANSTTTLAMKNGVQSLKQDLWMDMTDEEYSEYLSQGGEGFSYTENIQPILDSSCISCHSDTSASEIRIGAKTATSDSGQQGENETYLFSKDSTFSYLMTETKLIDSTWKNSTYSDSTWNTGKGPFGAGPTPPTGQNTEWNIYNKKGYIYLRNKFSVTKNQIANGKFILNIAYDESPEVYVNGVKVFDKSSNGNNAYITEYLDFDITDKIKSALKEGENTVAVYTENTAGGAYIGLSLRVKENAVSVEKPYTDILSLRQSGWTYRDSNPDSDNWMTEDYTATQSKGWTLNAKGGFGNGKFAGADPATPWKTSVIYLRKNFNISDDIYNKINSGNYKVYLDIGYDEEPTVYLNGVKILSLTGYSTAYEKQDVTYAFKKAMKKGENLLAISGKQTYGGQYMDCGISVRERADADTTQFSLKGDSVLGQNEKMYYSLSYLVLTGAVKSGNEFHGNASNSLTNWVSAFSDCAVQEPESAGSTQSNLVTLLSDGHYSASLSEKDLYAIKAWIDLGVPYRGSYDENSNWSLNDQRHYDEMELKRDFYETQDKQTKLKLANKLGTESLTLKAKYTAKSGTVLAETSGNGQLVLNVNNRKLTAGDKITVDLPEGCKYIYFNLSSRVAESLIYVPDGHFEYTVPSDITKLFPKMVYSNDHQTISVRIPAESEMSTVQNLAVNPYDSANSTAYPHASATNTYSDNTMSEFLVRNAIDGYTDNASGHGVYPAHSWGPNQNSDSTYTVDFGRNVSLSSFNIVLRGDFDEDNPSGGHDGGFTRAYVVLSDGTEKEFKIVTTHKTQTYSIKDIFGSETVNTTSFKLKLTPETGKWSALTEVEVYGTEASYSLPETVGAPALTGITVEEGSLDSVFATDKYSYTVNANRETGVIFKDFAVNSDTTEMKVYVNGTETELSGGALTVKENAKVKIVLKNKKGDTVEYLFDTVAVSDGELKELILQAEQLYGDTEGKENIVNEREDLKNAIKKAKKVADRDDCTKAEITEAYGELESKMNILKRTLGEETAVSKDSLKAEIDSAKELEEQEYTEKSWKNFKEALENAEKVYSDSSSTDSDVKNAENALKDAVSKLVHTGDSTSLWLPVSLLVAIIASCIFLWVNRRRIVAHFAR